MKEQKNQKKYEKPRQAIVWPSEIPGNKKLTLTIPGVNVGYITVCSHESLSTLKKWCDANNYSMDISRLTKPTKSKYVKPDNETEEYFY